jgi:hypothetical protein
VSYERDDAMRRQEGDHAFLDMRTRRPYEPMLDCRTRAERICSNQLEVANGRIAKLEAVLRLIAASDDRPRYMPLVKEALND